MATEPTDSFSYPPPAPLGVLYAIIATIAVFLMAGTIGLLWAFGPTPAGPENPPVVHIFSPDLTIQSPHTYTSPTSVADWLNQLATATPTRTP